MNKPDDVTIRVFYRANQLTPTNVFYRLLCDELNKTTAVLHAAHGMRQPANRIQSRRQNDRMKKDLQDLQDDS